MREPKKQSLDDRFRGIIEQADRCIDLLETIGAANRRILEHVKAGDAAWSIMASQGYNSVCAACFGQQGEQFASNQDLRLLAKDPDLKKVCDSRWLLGQAVDVLRRRLNRLDPIPPEYDDLEIVIRNSVTSPDRSPEELDGAVGGALDRARRAKLWTPQPQGSLTDRWIQSLRNNPVVAILIIAAAVITTIGGALTVLPSSWKNVLDHHLASGQPATEGWVVAGDVDRGDQRRWSRGPYIDVVAPSGGIDRPYPIRTGDIVKLRRDSPAVIVSYKQFKVDKVRVVPPAADVDNPSPDDLTGAQFKSGVEYEVVDMGAIAPPQHDPTIWLRLVPYKAS